MTDAVTLAKYYQTLTDPELMNLEREGGFTEEARRLLADELRRRNLGAGDLKRYELQGQRIKLHEETAEKGDRRRGTGLLFFGKRYRNKEDRQDNIQVRTKWFALCWIPLVPVASYRFKISGNVNRGSAEDGKQRVIDRVPLDLMQVSLTWLKTVAVVGSLVLLMAGMIWFQNHRRS